MQGIMSIPPKSLAVLVDRAKRLDGCVRLSPDSEVFEFPQGGNVAVLIGLECPTGHQGKDPRRAAELREMIKAREAAQ